MKRLAFAFMVAAVAAAGACQRAERAEQEGTSDSMHMMDEPGMTSDTAHMMAGDTAQRM